MSGRFFWRGQGQGRASGQGRRKGEWPKRKSAPHGPMAGTLCAVDRDIYEPLPCNSCGVAALLSTARIMLTGVHLPPHTVAARVWQIPVAWARARLGLRTRAPARRARAKAPCLRRPAATHKTQDDQRNTSGNKCFFNCLSALQAATSVGGISVGEGAWRLVPLPGWRVLRAALSQPPPLRPTRSPSPNHLPIAPVLLAHPPPFNLPVLPLPSFPFAATLWLPHSSV